MNVVWKSLSLLQCCLPSHLLYMLSGLREGKEVASPTTHPSLARANVPMRKLHVSTFTQYPKGSAHTYTVWAELRFSGFWCLTFG